MKEKINQGNINKWGTEGFHEVVIDLYNGFLTFCCLWGWIFGGHDGDQGAEEKALQFTRENFPVRHPGFNFEMIFRILLHAAIVREDGVLIVRPEINTIYDGDKHDLITPIIETLADDCTYWAHFVEPYLKLN